MSTTSTNLSMTLAESTDLVDVAVHVADNFALLDTKWAASGPTTMAIGDSASAGSSTVVARADHRHGGPGFGAPSTVATSNSEGASTAVARADHIHKDRNYWMSHGPESFDIESGTTEDMVVYVPSTPVTATLILRGRALRSGLVAAHTHTVTSNVSATTNSTGGQSLTSGAQSADHTHSGTTASNGGESLTSGTVSADHTHTLTTSGASADHSHSGTSAGHSADHTHSATTSAGSAHNHSLYVDANPPSSSLVTTGATGPFARTDNIVAESAHTHTVTTGGVSAGHTHTMTTGGVSADHTHSGTTSGISANHTHSVTTSSHTHTVTTGGVSAGHTHAVTTSNHSHTVTVTNNQVTSGSTGSGGFTASSRPSGVSVVINGVDRTSALSGPWGSTGSDWNQNALNVAAYMTAAAENTITLSCTGGGRLKAQVLLEL